MLLMDALKMLEQYRDLIISEDELTKSVPRPFDGVMTFFNFKYVATINTLEIV